MTSPTFTSEVSKEEKSYDRSVIHGHDEHMWTLGTSIEWDTKDRFGIGTTTTYQPYGGDLGIES